MVTKKEKSTPNNWSGFLRANDYALFEPKNDLILANTPVAFF
jgi:hypothetical protein